MKNHLMRTLLCLTAALVLSLSCALGETAETTEAPAAEEQAAATEAAPVLLVTVNGEEITDQNPHFIKFFEAASNAYAQSGYDTTDPALKSFLQYLAMEYATESFLYRQKAAELGITDRQEEFRTEAKADWDDIVTDFATQMSSLTEDSTEEDKAAARADAIAYIESYYGYTEESFIAEVVDEIIAQEVLKAVAGEISVSEDDIIAAFNQTVEADKAQYEGNVSMYEFYTSYYGQKSYYIPSGYRGILHILLKVDENLMKTYTDLSAQFEEQKQAATEEAVAEETAAADAEETAAPDAEPTAEPTATPEPVTQEQVDAAKQAILDSVQAKVDEIKAKFEAGTPFADLIAEYGTDPRMQDAANLANGYLVHKDSILWDPAFTAGAMALEKVGDMGDPVLGSNGVHILYYLRDVPAGAVDMTEEIRSAVEKDLVATKTNEVSKALLDEWKEKSDIQYTEAGQALVDAFAAIQAQTEAATEAPAEETPVEESTEAPAEEATEAPAEEATEAPAQ